MKYSLLALFCCVFSVGFSQDYACFRRNDTSFYINRNGYLRGFRVDNAWQEGSDSVFYPYRMVRSDHGTLVSLPDTSRGHWLGSNIRRKPNGDFLFSTAWLDTIVIKTQAAVGDSWLFYDDTTSRRYVATLISEDTMTVKGVLDSVKTIKISAYLGSIPNLADSTNGFKIVLSKGHGFASVFDLYMFPYVSTTSVPYSDLFFEQMGSISSGGFEFTQVEFHVPTLLELYDFAVGDVFVSGGDTWSYISYEDWMDYDSVTAKTVVSPFKTVYTTFHKYRYRWAPTGPSDPGSHSYGEGSGGFIADTSLAFPFVSMPEQNGPERMWHYLPVDTTKCVRSSWYRMEDVVVFEGGPHEFEYKIGFPRLVSATFTPPWPEDIGYHSITSEGLIFSIKNGVPCGNRADVYPAAVEDVNKPASFNVFPNPANGELHVAGSYSIGAIEIIDVFGRRMQSMNVEEVATTIDISSLPQGVYVIRAHGLQQRFTKY